MHGDRDYLEFLQESTFKNRSFISKEADPVIVITEDELREEIQDMFAEEEIESLMESWEGQYLSTAGQGDLAGQSALAGAAAVGVAALAVKAYKKFFSQAAKACGGKSGSEKTMCMNKFKEKAKQAKISTLKSGMSKCSKDKNPAKCKASLQKKIAAAGG